MRVADGGSGLPWPAGDPDQVRAAARQLDRAAGGLGRVSSGAQRTAVRDGWSGAAASSFAGRTTTVAGGVGRVGDGTGRAGEVLGRYADQLQDAQDRARRAAERLVAAAEERGRALREAAAEGRRDLTGLAEDAAERARREARRAQEAAEDRAIEAYDAARRAAEREAQEAVDEARRAGQAAARALGAVVDAVRNATNKQILDWIGGPDAANGLLGLFGQGITAARFLEMQRAMRASDLSALRARNPAGWAAVQRAVAQHGADSLEALAAKLRFQSSTVTSLMDDMKTAAVPLGRVPAGGAARALDILGKLGLVTAVASDILILTDDSASGLDKGMAGANLAGIGLTVGGSAAATALGLTAAASWIPVVGQVLVAGTTIYFVGTFVHENWDSITGGVADAWDWTGQQLQDYADEVRRDLAEARDTLVGAYDAAEDTVRDLADDAGELLDDAGELVGGARDRAGEVLSSVNPFD